MQRGDRSRARSQQRRVEQRRILVFCGAERTEPQYLRGLLGRVNPKSTLVRIRYKGIAPHQLVTFAAKFSDRQRDQYDEVWCVVDVDDYDIEFASRVARKAGVALVVSNPCFEFWLLLHHEHGGAPPLSSCDEAATRLKRYLPHYDKAKLRFGDFADGVEAAIKRAKQLDETGAGWQRNPSSNVWRLAERLMEK